MRTFCKTSGQKNIPIQAIGLSLYEELGQGTEEKLGKEVIRTQWLDFSTLGSRPLLGKRILIVVRKRMLLGFRGHRTEDHHAHTYRTKSMIHGLPLVMPSPNSRRICRSRYDRNAALQGMAANENYVTSSSLCLRISAPACPPPSLPSSSCTTS
jgi:hypothetical protein